jgi:hypothetical protein
MRSKNIQSEMVSAISASASALSPPPPFHVVLRCRDINAKERQAGAHRFPYRKDLSYCCAIVPHTNHEQDSFITLFDPDSTASLTLPTMTSALQEGERRFPFRDVCGPTTSNHDVYHIAVRPLVEAAWEGYHATCFAYGVTGTGKSYTMVGEPPLREGEERSVLGMCHYVVRDLFDLVASHCNSHQEGSTVVALPQITATYVELYNEDIRDLLVDSAPSSGLTDAAFKYNSRSSSGAHVGSSVASTFGRQHRQDGSSSAGPQKIDIVDDPVAGTVLRNATSITVTTMAALEVMLEQGNLRRTKASTNTNQCSSRSHAVLQLTIRRREENKSDYGVSSGSSSVEMTSRLSLVDLAGSERAHATSDLSGGGAGGGVLSQQSLALVDRRREGATINKSLLALGNCINALGQAPPTTGSGRSSSSLSLSASSSSGAPFVPYRDSKLTRLLRDSLGGNTRTVMIATISPSCVCYEETLATLKYATRAKAISRHVTANVVVTYAAHPAAAVMPTGSTVAARSSGVMEFSIPPRMVIDAQRDEERESSSQHGRRLDYDNLYPYSSGNRSGTTSAGQQATRYSSCSEVSEDEEREMELLEEWEAKVVQARTQLRVAERTADKLLHGASCVSSAARSFVSSSDGFTPETQKTPHSNPPALQSSKPRMTYVDPYANPGEQQKASTMSQLDSSRVEASSADVVRDAEMSRFGKRSETAAAPVLSKLVEYEPQFHDNEEQRRGEMQKKEEKLLQFHRLQKQLLDLVEAKKKDTAAGAAARNLRQAVNLPSDVHPKDAQSSKLQRMSESPADRVATGGPRPMLGALSPNKTYTVGGRLQEAKKASPTVTSAGHQGMSAELSATPATSIVETIRAHWQKEKLSTNARTVDAFLGTTQMTF